MNGSPPGQYSRRDVTDLSADAVMTAAACVLTYVFDQWFPDMPEAVQLSLVVVLFAGLKFAKQFLTDTQRF